MNFSNTGITLERPTGPVFRLVNVAPKISKTGSMGITIRLKDVTNINAATIAMYMGTSITKSIDKKVETPGLILGNIILDSLKPGSEFQPTMSNLASALNMQVGTCINVNSEVVDATYVAPATGELINTFRFKDDMLDLKGALKSNWSTRTKNSWIKKAQRIFTAVEDEVQAEEDALEARAEAAIPEGHSTPTSNEVHDF